MIVNDKKTNINDLQNKVIAYTKDNYGNIPYEVETDKLGENAQVLIVKKFKDKEASQDYQFLIRDEKAVFGNYIGAPILQLVISAENYQTLLKEKEFAKYLIFYNINYPDVASF